MTIDLELAGRTLEGVQFGYTLTLQFTDLHEVQIEQPIRITAGGEPVEVSAEAEWSEPISALVRDSVTGAEALADGTLVITFAGGTELRVGPNPDYESWTVTGPGGMRVVCLPGGELAVWDAAEVTYYGSLAAGRTRDRPAGVYRRKVVDGHAVDEAFTRNLRWEPTTALHERDLGYNEVDYVEITRAEADAFVQRVSAKLSG